MTTQRNGALPPPPSWLHAWFATYRRQRRFGLPRRSDSSRRRVSSRSSSQVRRRARSRRQVLVALARAWCPRGRGDELGGHGEDEHRYQRKRHGPRGVDHRLLRLLASSSVRPSSVFLCGFFDFAHLRDREWMKISFNCASEALAMLGGTAAFLLATSFGSTITTRDPEPRRAAAHRAAYLGLNTVFVAFARGCSSTDEAYLPCPEGDLRLSTPARFPLRSWGSVSGGST